MLVVRLELQKVEMRAEMSEKLGYSLAVMTTMKLVLQLVDL